MKQVSYWGRTNIRRHRKKFSRLGGVAPENCASLTQFCSIGLSQVTFTTKVDYKRDVIIFGAFLSIWSAYQNCCPSTRTQVRNLEALNGFLWKFACVIYENLSKNCGFLLDRALIMSTLYEETPTRFSAGMSDLNLNIFVRTKNIWNKSCETWHGCSMLGTVFLYKVCGFWNTQTKIILFVNFSSQGTEI
jgi:hypothetical protein